MSKMTKNIIIMVMILLISIIIYFFLKKEYSIVGLNANNIYIVINDSSINILLPKDFVKKKNISFVGHQERYVDEYSFGPISPSDELIISLEYDAKNNNYKDRIFYYILNPLKSNVGKISDYYRISEYFQYKKFNIIENIIYNEKDQGLKNELNESYQRMKQISDISEQALDDNNYTATLDKSNQLLEEVSRKILGDNFERHKILLNEIDEYLNAKGNFSKDKSYSNIIYDSKYILSKIHINYDFLDGGAEVVISSDRCIDGIFYTFAFATYTNSIQGIINILNEYHRYIDILNTIDNYYQ